MDRRRIQRTIRELLREHDQGKSICPSEVARALAPDAWRTLMGDVRAAAGALADQGAVRCTQRGATVDPRTARGALRITHAFARDANQPSPQPSNDPYRGVDFHAHPDAYRIGRGEEGVFAAEPYKSELLPLWRFRTPDVARASAKAIWEAFVAYRNSRDFVGMDMARKYLQMGFTRARRYANHASGRKYPKGSDGSPRKELPTAPDAEKADAAAIFHAAWQKVERDRTYAAWRERRRLAKRAGARTKA